MTSKYEPYYFGQCFPVSSSLFAASHVKLTICEEVHLEEGRDIDRVDPVLIQFMTAFV